MYIGTSIYIQGKKMINIYLLNRMAVEFYTENITNFLKIFSHLEQRDASQFFCIKSHHETMSSVCKQNIYYIQL